MRIKYKMTDYDYEMESERYVKEQGVDKKQKAGKLKPAMQRHNQKRLKVWLQKVPRKENK